VEVYCPLHSSRVTRRRCAQRPFALVWTCTGELEPHSGQIVAQALGKSISFDMWPTHVREFPPCENLRGDLWRQLQWEPCSRRWFAFCASRSTAISWVLVSMT
jgi:hypothetical protein